MKNTKSQAMALLVLLGIGDILFILPGMGMVMPDEPRPPVAIVWLSVLLGVVSLAAAYGLSKGMSWAIPAALGSRALDILSTLPAFFMDLSALPLVIASLFIILSAVNIALLVRLPKGSPAIPA